jgi:hypothetical protein
VRVESRPGRVDVRGVQVQEHAFVRAVLRFAALSWGPGPQSPECRRLAAVLGDPDVERGVSQRRWLRLAVRIAATVKRSDVQGPATVVDIGAGGLRLADHGGLAKRGTRTVVSLRPRHGTRVDVPCEVVHQNADGTVGLRFCGAPLVMFERRAA